MKPHRIRATHELVTAYDMLPKMHVLVSFSNNDVEHLSPCSQRPIRATPEIMSSFHTDEYIHFLNRVTPETAEDLTYHGTRCEFFPLMSISSNVSSPRRR
jgi:histone deacetylase 1/2